MADTYITSLILSYLSAQEGQTVPDSLDSLMAYIVDHLEVKQEAKGENGRTFVYGSVEPSDKTAVWFRLEEATNKSLGWRAWDGDEWAAIPVVPQNAATAKDLPSNPVAGQKVWVESISTEVVFNGERWITSHGSKGQVSFVRGSAIGATTDFLDGATSTILARNPGWKLVDEGVRGRVLVAAGTGTSLTHRDPESSYGAETVNLTKDQIPPHQHDIVFQKGKADLGDQSQQFFTDTTNNPGTTGEVRVDKNQSANEAVDLHQPTFALYAIEKVY
jgi:hypothetical protein